MAISVDTVYQRVLAILNKEQRGYLTPQEFNLFANQAQRDILEQYFYDINQFTKMLPHRYPFLLIDKIMAMDKESILGVKNVTMNEPFFQGHFPNNPVMPGVLQIEAMAQVGGIFSLNRYEDPVNYLTYFLKIDNVKFRNKVWQDRRI